MTADERYARIGQIHRELHKLDAELVSLEKECPHSAGYQPFPTSSNLHHMCACKICGHVFMNKDVMIG